MSPSITIDGQQVRVPEGSTILDAARQAEMYIPTLCWHPAIAGHPPPDPADRIYQGETERKGSGDDPFLGCDLCVVEIQGRDGLSHSCYIPAEDGMTVLTESDAIGGHRHAAFGRIMAEHPRSCLSCAQKEGCPREPCSLNVPVHERCCTKLGRCELERLHDYLGFASPLPPFSWEEGATTRSALFDYDWNLCVGCLRCVRACQGLRKVGSLGYVMEDGKARVGFTSPTPEDGDCRFCGACVEICPTGAILDRAREKIPCREACPGGLDIPGYVRAVALGKPEIAARIVRDTLPLGRILGRVCHAPCESACRRTALNEPVNICSIKRFACDTAEPGPPRPVESTTKKVAVIGSGPAGLAAAWFLARKGHGVTILEEAPEPGGMLRWGIPAFRLPTDVVHDEIDQIRNLGVEIRTSTRIEDPDALKQEFDEVLMATGLPRSRRLEIPGIDLEGVWHGLEFLLAARIGMDPRPGSSVLVIGGGNVAIDCALTARRLGVESVTAACLESEEEMPSFEWEIRQARDEGVAIRNRWGPVSIEKVDGRLKCEFQRCTAVFDEGGGFAPTFDESERTHLEADGIIAAIGQQEDASVPISGAFAAGDITGGPFSIIDAIASGKRAAAELDRHLGGDGIIPGEPLQEDPEEAIGVREGFASMARVSPSGPPGTGFDEIEPGYSRDEARLEASRCLQCDLRLTIPEGPMAPILRSLVEISRTNASEIPEAEGVLQIYGGDREVLQITGTRNLREELEGVVDNDRARYFTFEVDPYYTKRESELLQAYLQQHGEMPEGLEDLDDLF